MTADITLKYGNGEMRAVIPEGRFVREWGPVYVPPVADLERMIVNGIRNPIASPPLEVLAAKAGKVTIVISDQTRPLPSSLILPFLLKELAQAGVSSESVTVVIGVGNHRPATEDEKEHLLGSVYGQVRCFHSKETGYKMMGVTKRGTPVEVSVPVAQADLVIALGNIEFHQLAGYSGGVKAVAVGAASHRAIEHNHRLSTLHESGLGMLDENIVRRDMEEFAQISGLGFIINVVLNQEHRIVSLAAGDPIEAHRVGCETARRMYMVNIPEPADVVIASPGGAPRDNSVYQSQKSVYNALQAVVDGGIVIVASQCREGFGDPVFEQVMNQAANPADIEEKAGREFVLGGHKASLISKAVQKARIFWVSDMAEEAVRRLFFEPFGALQPAIDKAMKIKGSEAGVIVMPWAGLTVPCLAAVELPGRLDYGQKVSR